MADDKPIDRVATPSLKADGTPAHDNFEVIGEGVEETEEERIVRTREAPVETTTTRSSSAKKSAS